MKRGTNYGDATGCAFLFLAGGVGLVVGLIYAVAHLA